MFGVVLIAMGSARRVLDMISNMVSVRSVTILRGITIKESIVKEETSQHKRDFQWHLNFSIKSASL